MNYSGFFGKNGLKPFIGQIPLGQTENRTGQNGWSNRFQIRVQGYDSKSGAILSNDNLRWATAITPTNYGNGNKGSCGYSGGETVFGFFLDDDCQHAVIMGSFPRSNSLVEMSAAQQETAQSLEFKLPNIFNTPHNPASSWNYKSGSDGTPSGQQTPYQPTQTAFTQGLNLLG
jgi:hypothetical protein